MRGEVRIPEQVLDDSGLKPLWAAEGPEDWVEPLRRGRCPWKCTCSSAQRRKGHGPWPPSVKRCVYTVV